MEWDVDEMVKKDAYSTNPFTDTSLWSKGVIVCSIEKLITFKEQGLLIFTQIPRYINLHDATVKLDIAEMCKDLFGTFNETLATRLRRGRRDLLNKGVIAPTPIKNVYWVNKMMIWKMV